METKELIELLKSCGERDCGRCPELEECVGPAWLLRKAAEMLEEQSVGTVIYCKECRYCFMGECSHPAMGSDDRDARLYINDDDFCSRGKQK